MDFLSNLNTNFLFDSLTESFVITDEHGLIQYQNNACEELFGYQSDELHGKNITILMNLKDASDHHQHLGRYQSDGTSRVIGSMADRPLAALKKDQTLFPVDIKISSFEQDNKNYFIGIIRDLSELTQSQNKLDHILKSTDTILYSLEFADNKLSTTWISPNITNLLGYTQEEAIAEDWWISHLHPDDKKQVLLNFDLFLQQGTLEHEYRFQTKSGHYVWIQDKLKLDNILNTQTINGSWNDISEKKSLLSTLIKSEERLAKSQVFANIGTWDWNIQTGELYWSDRIAPLFGYNDGELETTYDNFLAALHPDDKDDVINAITQCIEHNTEYNIEHRVIWPDGQIRWVHEKGDVVKDPNGLPQHMLGVVTDIHEQKILQIQQAQYQNLLNTLHESLTVFTIQSDFRKPANMLLNGLLSTTESEYGFIGEVLYKDDDSPYLKTHAITNIAWNDETQKLYEEWSEKGLEFTNMDTLFGQVITTGKIVVSNSPATDPRAAGLPEGHPPMHSFLGIPVYYGQTLIGMYGLANRPNGYDEKILELLKAFSSTYATIIQAKRSLEIKKQTQIDLIHTKEQAESANKAKSIFLSSMSHELRTPLNAILGFAQLLNLQENLNDESKSNVKDIIYAGRHLSKLINEVLDLAKIESGKTTVSLEPVSFTDLIDECEMLIVGLSEKHQIEVIFSDNCSKNYFIHADYTKLKQVILNLITNAIKYNNKNGTVIIDCNPNQNNELTVSIKDNGPGIRANDIPKLFVPFNRLGAESDSGIEGSGIGLVITKQLLDLMHGQLFVNSTFGEGSEFSFTIPMTNITPAEQPELVNNDTNNHHQKNKKIFYIEDNLANLSMVKQLIEKWTDFEFLSATDPLVGIEDIKHHMPDIILLDINLPKMNGHEVIRHLKEHKICTHASIFALTANAMESDVNKIWNAGFDEYVSKPIDIQNLLDKLNKAIQ